MSQQVNSQNELLLVKLMEYYKQDNNLQNMLVIINGESQISLRIVDWFSTNYAKKNYTVYPLDNGQRFKVYNDYKLKLKAYSKKRFDPFCRWQRITIPYGEEGLFIETTIGQLNFFKWALENKVIDYIKNHYKAIEEDMNNRNSNSRKKTTEITLNRKKREELSISAIKTIKKEDVEIVVKFN
tara:strand:- start:102 stop:650 length:549 start_codon:yes stop_codon:yes gene_type:complete